MKFVCNMQNIDYFIIYVNFISVDYEIQPINSNDYF